MQKVRFVVDEMTLSLFEDKIDWKRISQSSTIALTQSLIDRFQRVDWGLGCIWLENPSIQNLWR